MGEPGSSFGFSPQLRDPLVIELVPWREHFQGDQARRRLKLNRPPDDRLASRPNRFDQQVAAHHLGRRPTISEEAAQGGMVEPLRVGQDRLGGKRATLSSRNHPGLLGFIQLGVAGAVS